MMRNLWHLIPIIVFAVLFIFLYIACNIKVKNQKYNGIHIDSMQADTNMDQELHCNIYNLSQPLKQGYPCVSLKTKIGRTPICIHNVTQDVWVSGNLAKNGQWESLLTDALEYWLRGHTNADTGLIDIGANLGVFTLTAALHGVKVVAVEPSIENLKRIRKSLEMGNLGNNVVLLHNAVSDTRSNCIMKQTKGNIAAAKIIKMDQEIPGYRQDLVETILMDDLLEVITFKNAIIKIDIEGHELEAFKMAKNLFSELHVPHIIMEWKHVAKRPGCEQLLLELGQLGYLPYEHFASNTPLNLNNFHSWPRDIFFSLSKHN